MLDANGYRALRLGTVASAAWAVCAALLVPLTISDVSGQPVVDHLNPLRVWSLAGLITTASTWRWIAVLAAVVALASLSVFRWSWTPLLLVAALVTLIPLGLTGHSSAGGAHDLATNSLLIHLVAGSLWAGGLLALLAHALRGGHHTDLAARRFSAIALWCWVAMALSGLVNALLRVVPSDLLTTGYGRLVAAKFTALCMLGVVGWRQRRAAVAGLRSDPSSPEARNALIRLALVEAAVFGLTFDMAPSGWAVRRRHQPRSGCPRLPKPRSATTSTAAHRGTHSVRLALRPDLRHGRNRLGRALPDGGAAAAPPRRQLAAGPDPGLAARLPGFALRDVVGCRSLRCQRCPACTWSPTWRCRCWSRSCWCWALR